MDKLIRIKNPFIFKVVGQEFGIYSLETEKLLFACKCPSKLQTKENWDLLNSLYLGIRIEKLKESKYVLSICQKLIDSQLEILEIIDLNAAKEDDFFKFTTNAMIKENLDYYKRTKKIYLEYISKSVGIVSQSSMYSNHLKMMLESIGFNVFILKDEKYEKNLDIYFFIGNFSKVLYETYTEKIKDDAILFHVLLHKNRVQVGPLIFKKDFRYKRQVYLPFVTKEQQHYSLVPLHIIYMSLGIIIKEMSFICNNNILLLTKDSSLMLDNIIYIDNNSLDAFDFGIT